MKHLPIILFLSIIILVISCSKKDKDMIVDEETMVELLVDMHKYEALISSKPGDYISDSVRKLYRQTILKKHNVSQQQFDSSLAWYGRHIDDYVKIYDDVLKIYDTQLLATNERAEQTGEIYEGIANDADNLWQKASLQTLSWKDENKNLTFEITDSTLFEKGERLRWQLRFTNVSDQITMMLGVDYNNDITSYMFKEIRKDGKYNITLQTDSSLKVNRLFGIVRYTPKKNEIVFLDSIVVDKLPLQAKNYSQKFGQRVFKMPKPKLIDLQSDTSNIITHAN